MMDTRSLLLTRAFKPRFTEELVRLFAEGAGEQQCLIQRPFQLSNDYSPQL